MNGSPLYQFLLRTCWSDKLTHDPKEWARGGGGQRFPYCNPYAPLVEHGVCCVWTEITGVVKLRVRFDCHAASGAV